MDTQNGGLGVEGIEFELNFRVFLILFLQGLITKVY